MLSLPFASGIALAVHAGAESALALAAASGCTHWYVDLNHDQNSLASWDATREEHLRDAAGHLGLQPVVHGSLDSALACEIDERRRRGVQVALAEVEFAHQLGAPLVVHPSSFFEGREDPPKRDAALMAFSTSVLELEAAATGCGVQLWLENLPRRHDQPCYDSVFSAPAEYLKVLASASRSAMLLDVGHANVSAVPHRGFDVIARRLAAICFSDNDSCSDHHAPIGAGSIDFVRLLGEIRACQWRGIVVLETDPPDPARDVAELRRQWQAVEPATVSEDPCSDRSSVAGEPCDEVGHGPSRPEYYLDL